MVIRRITSGALRFALNSQATPSTSYSKTSGSLIVSATSWDRRSIRALQGHRYVVHVLEEPERDHVGNLARET
jgi:hypothetical protein